MVDGGCWVMGAGKTVERGEKGWVTFLLNVGTKNEKLLTKKRRDGMMVDRGSKYAQKEFL
jgi:hypothetical protein